MTFLQAVKAINSEWEIGITADSSDGKGNFYRTYYIVGSPTKADVEAICNHCKMSYYKGYFYRRII